MSDEIAARHLDRKAVLCLRQYSPPEVCAHAARQFGGFYLAGAARLDWEANRRAIDRINPGYDA